MIVLISLIDFFLSTKTQGKRNFEDFDEEENFFSFLSALLLF